MQSTVPGHRRSGIWQGFTLMLLLPVQALGAEPQPGIIGQAFIVFIVLAVLALAAARKLSKMAEKSSTGAEPRQVFIQVLLFGLLCAFFVPCLMILFDRLFT